MASLVEFAINKDKRLGAAHELLSLHLVYWQHLMEKVVEVRHPLVSQRVGLYRWILVKLHDLRVRWSRRLVSPQDQGRGPVASLF